MEISIMHGLINQCSTRATDGEDRTLNYLRHDGKGRWSAEVGGGRS